MFIYYIKIKINSKCKPKLFYSIFGPNQFNQPHLFILAGAYNQK